MCEKLEFYTAVGHIQNQWIMVLYLDTSCWILKTIVYIPSDESNNSLFMFKFWRLDYLNIICKLE